MSRYDENSGPVPNPAQYFLEWNSELNSFAFWKKGDDQQEGQRIPYPNPFKFAALKFMISITGFDENRRQGIYSNEVSHTRNEQLRVMYRDGSPLAKGLYSEIKEQVNLVGGRYTKSIYACTPKGVIVKINLKGGQLINFGLIEKYENRWQDEWIEVADFEKKLNKDEKEYSLPIFQFAHSFNPSEIEATDRAYKIVKYYFDSKAPVRFEEPAIPQAQVVSSQLTPGSIEDDDLPF